MQVESVRLLVLSPAEHTDIASLDFCSPLEQEGYAIHSVQTAAQYIPAIGSINPDLALLPITAESESLLNKIVDIDSHPPVLLFGAENQSELAGKMMVAGAEEYFLGCGQDPDEQGDATLLKHLVERTIASHRSLSELKTQSNVLKSKIDYMAQDQRAAFDVQQKLLPEPQRFGDISFSYQLVPRSGMSGDSVNCFELSDGRLLFYLADVAGHGILGGVIATALTLTAKTLADPEFDSSTQSSSDLLVWFNRAMLELKLERHVAMFLGVISVDRSQLEYSSAAHFPGTILCQENHCLYLELGGLPLGVCEAEYEARQVELSRIFELVLFSDGVLEILPKDSLENREKHLISLVESGARSVTEISDVFRLKALSDVPDDIAVLTIRRETNSKDLEPHE